MTQTLETYQTSQTSNFDKTRVDFITKNLIPKNHKNTQKLTIVMTKLERQDIGWLDILTAMANIAEDAGTSLQVAQVRGTTALSLKRTQGVRRNL